MLQMSVVRLPGRSLRLPTRIKYVSIDPVLHLVDVLQKSDQQGEFAFILACITEHFIFQLITEKWILGDNVLLSELTSSTLNMVPLTFIVNKYCSDTITNSFYHSVMDFQ